jgi:glycosyltransferase involved in cell wall biosynthesis
MDNLKISVIMSVYNGEKYLKEAIESILSQTFTDFEFIIVDDGSTDSSLAIIKSYNDERIKIINNEGNIGLTKSLNKALNEARGEYIARQDADDISLPNRFEEQLKFLEKHSEVVLLGTFAYSIDKKGKIVGKRIVLAKPRLKDILKENPFNHGSVMFKKEIVNQLGNYNELIRYSQDYEFWIRIAKHYDVRNLTQLLYKLRSHDSNIRLTNLEESTLHHLLVLRSVRGELDEELLKAVNENGIKSLRPYLNKEEQVYFYKAIAGMHVRNNNTKLARKEYIKIFVLNPFDITNDINIVRSYFGTSVISKTSKIYETYINFLKRLKNCCSR